MFSEMSVFAISRAGHNFCENLRSGNLSGANDGADPGVSHGGCRGDIFKIHIKSSKIYSCFVLSSTNLFHQQNLQL